MSGKVGADPLPSIRQISGQVSRGSAGEYQADEQAGVAPGRNRAAQLAIVKQMSRQVSRGSAGEYQAYERAVSRGSVAEYQADERAEVARLRWRVSGR